MDQTIEHDIVVIGVAHKSEVLKHRFEQVGRFETILETKLPEEKEREDIL